MYILAELTGVVTEILLANIYQWILYQKVPPLVGDDKCLFCRWNNDCSTGLHSKRILPSIVSLGNFLWIDCVFFFQCKHPSGGICQYQLL